MLDAIFSRAWVKLARDIGSPSVKVPPKGIPKDVAEERTLEQIGRRSRRAARSHTITV
jgi:hypothetical protein